MDGYVFIDQPRTGEANMAFDRQLLEAAEREQCAFVRLYRWSPATLSLGHFQADVDREIHPSSAHMPSVLRSSGGGAIVHDHEWTYAIAMPIGRNKIGAATELYDAVHASIVTGLRSLGWDASQWTKPCATNQLNSTVDSLTTDVTVRGCGVNNETNSKAARPAQPFLCFARRSCGDIVCQGYKIVGSAQRRLGASVLQHGSVLWHTSPFAPEIKGLSELPRTLPIVDSRSGVVERFLTSAPAQLETLGEILLSWIEAALVKSFSLSLHSWTVSQAVERVAVAKEAPAMMSELHRDALVRVHSD